MFFGKKLKELRLKANMGIRKFKEAMGTTLSVSELSDIEHGYVEIPDCGRVNAQIKVALGISHDDEDWKELMDLRWKPFVMQKMPEDILLSPLTHKTDGTQLSSGELQDLNDHIINHAKEHNKKAREYNKEHSGL